MKETELISKGWLYCTDVVEASLERNASILTPEGVAIRKKFIDTVRACKGKGVDELLSRQEIHHLLNDL